MSSQDQRGPTIVFSSSWDGASSFQVDTYSAALLYMVQQSRSVRNEADISRPSPSNFSRLQYASMSSAETMNRRLKRAMQQLHSQPLSYFENEDADSLVLELVD